jgi:UDP-N-acetylmuramyl pentapeptide phosphotransferase/UDP-N-acetylglucosamine-1-phosphate transferase
MPTKSVYDRALESAFPTPFWSIALFGCVPVLFFLIRVFRVLSESSNPILLELRSLLLMSCTLSVAGYWLTSTVVPKIAKRLLEHVPNLSGVDIGKRGLGGPKDGKPVAESLGIVPGTVFLIVLTLTATFARVGGVELSARFQQSDFNVAIGSITMAVLLGLVDDLVDLRWREKLVVGAVMALPLVGSYSGPTSVILPRQLRFLVAVDPTQQYIELTSVGRFLENFVDIDRRAHGSLIFLGPW